MAGLLGMITEKDIKQAEKEEKRLVESYLKGITDFVRWTSTVAIAAILWVGNIITSTAGFSRAWLLISLVFLVLSLGIAVLTVRLVLIAWATEWNLASEDYNFCLLKKLKAIDPPKVTEQKETEQISRLIKAIDDTKPFSRPTGFSTWVSLHIGLLLIGLLTYVFAQIFGTI